MSKWPKKTIMECSADEPYSTQIGPFGKALTPSDYTKTGVALLRGVNVNHGRFHDDDFVFVSEETADRLSKFESFPGDVLLVHKGTLGKIGIMPMVRRFERYLMGNSMLRVKCNPEILLPIYLYYWLLSKDGQNYLSSRVSQVGVPQIQRPLSTLREAELPVPPIREQEEITRCLLALDEKIELNRKLNETLEGMARALFQSWFVDFDPVKAKLAAVRHGRDPERACMAALSGKLRIPPGKPRPDTLDRQLPTAEALDAAIAALDSLTAAQHQNLAQTASHFPANFQDSELGLIPEGWEVKVLGDFAENIRIPSDPTKEPADLPYVGLEHIDKKRFCLSVHGRADSVDSQKSKFDVGDFLYGKLRPYFHKVCYPQISGICSTDILVIRPIRRLYKGLVGSVIFDEDFVNFTNIRSTGTRMPRASWKDMASFEIAVPSEDLISDFNQQCESCWDMFLPLSIQSRTLADLRDTLLPKLLSGELSVGGLDKFVKSAMDDEQ